MRSCPQRGFISSAAAERYPLGTRYMPLRVLLSCIAALGIFVSAVSGQSQSSKPAVFVRQIRIDSMLLFSGVDSTRVRAAVLSAVQSAGRLATDTIRAPSLDIDVAAPRLASGGIYEPQGFIRLEVGRNLVERGRVTRLQWARMFDLVSAPTWRELSRGTLAEVLRAVHTYLLDRNGGA